MAGLAPAPYCGMILADFGATVIRVDRCVDGEVVSFPIDQLTRGKQSIAIDLKGANGRALLSQLAQKSDVIIDSYRPGVMERLGMGPDQIMASCPTLVYARLTGYGQTGPYAHMAGHDINYIALSGLLSIFGRSNEAPLFPGNIVGDFAAGGLLCAFGIVLALFERKQTGRGKLIDSSMMDGAAYLSSFVFRLKQSANGYWDEPRGQNMLDSGCHYYEVYQTKDGKYISVGAIEPQFYQALLKGMALDGLELPDQNDRSEWPRMKQLFKETFLGKDREQWETIFKGTDACVAPVLEMDELHQHPHSGVARQLVYDNKSGDGGKDMTPAPRLYNHGSKEKSYDSQQQSYIDRLAKRPMVYAGGNTISILKAYGYSASEIDGYLAIKSVAQTTTSML
eukprot:gene16863-20048_t